MSTLGISFTSSVGTSKKSTFQHCIPFIVTGSLGIEMIIIITLITFYQTTDSSENLFYVSTVSYIIISTIYFAWHSLVKENAFELLAFSLMSTILNSVAIYLAFRHDVADAFKYSAMGFFVVVQLMYYVMCYISYRFFENAMKDKLDMSFHVRKLRAIKTFEMFISMIKVDFMLYAIIVSTYLFYASVKWDSFETGALIIGIVLSATLIFHSIIGIFAVRAM